jgi:hypothetical protein
MGIASYKTGRERIVEEKVNFELVTSFMQTYKGTYKYLLGFRSPWCAPWANFLIEQMNEENRVDIGVKTVRLFIENIMMDGKVAPPTERNMKVVTKELRDRNVIVCLHKGNYMINPLVYWKGDIKARKQLVGLFIASNIDLKPNYESNGGRIEHSEIQEQRDTAQTNEEIRDRREQLAS